MSINKVMKILTVVTAMVIAATPCAFAKGAAAPEPVEQCADLVRECFTTTGVERSNCLFSAAKHPFCEGSTLGKLTYKRWAMSPVRPMGLDSPPALLGPQLIDQECLANFDNKMLSNLIEADYSKTTLRNLDKSLVSCTKQVSDQLTRP